MFSPKIIGYVLLLALVLASYGGVYYLGIQHCKAAINTTVIKSEIKQDKEVLKVQKEQAKREIVYRDRLKVVHDVQDNCLNQPMPPDIVRSLHSGS